MERWQTGSRSWRSAIAAGLLGFLPTTTSRAQYTAHFQTNIISGITSNWLGAYFVGYTNFADALWIENGGVLSSSGGYIGYLTGAGNNSVVVSGGGSVWSNTGTFSVGYFGAANTLVISNGGKVMVSTPIIPSVVVAVGFDTASSNNHVVVTRITARCGPTRVFFTSVAMARAMR